MNRPGSFPRRLVYYVGRAEVQPRRRGPERPITGPNGPPIDPGNVTVLARDHPKTNPNFRMKGYGRKTAPKTAEKQQQQEKEKVTKRAAHFARRPLVMFFLLLLFFRRFRGPFFGRIPSSES